MVGVLTVGSGAPGAPEPLVATVPLGTDVSVEAGDPAGAGAQWQAMSSEHRHAQRGTSRWTSWFGVILVLFGALALIDTFLPAWADNGRFLGPAFIVGIGVILVAAGVRRETTAP